MEMTPALCRNPLDDISPAWSVKKPSFPSWIGDYSGFGFSPSTVTTTSGSAIFHPYLADYSSPVLVRIVSRANTTPPVSVEPTVPSQVRSVLSYFGLSKSDLSKILGITRPTLYAWLDGHIEPKSENSRRLCALAALVDGSPESQGQALFHAYLERPMSGIPLTLIEALAEPTLDSTLIRTMVAKIRVMTNERNARIGKGTPKAMQVGNSESPENRILEENLIAIGPED